MSESAQALVERPASAGVQKREAAVILPTTPQAIQQDTVRVISDNLAQTPYPQPPAKILPEGDANTVLANIESGGIGATIVDASDHLIRAVENLKGDVTGSNREYVTKKEPTGHGITMGRIARRVLSTGIAEKVHNLLSKIRPGRGV